MKDEAEAVKWLRKAAERNHARAISGLGCCYYFGQGVTKDYLEAVNWFRKAAEQNEDLAQYNLGDCYRLGEGVEKNLTEAYKWMCLAKEHDNDDAKKACLELEGMMSSEQVEEGKQRANVWLEQHKEPVRA